MRRPLLTALLVTLILPVVSADAPVPYRRASWPHWTGRCLNTRERVLIEESRRPVTLSPDGCSVLRGEWFDIYTGRTFTYAAALDIDHLVSLSAAHRAGGWQWAPARKRAYANALDDPDHLVAVMGAENRRKSDKGPSEWLPPRAAARCWYVLAYARIAERWQLRLPAADDAAIRTVQQSCAVSR